MQATVAHFQEPMPNGVPRGGFTLNFLQGAPGARNLYWFPGTSQSKGDCITALIRAIRYCLRHEFLMIGHRAALNAWKHRLQQLLSHPLLGQHFADNEVLSNDRDAMFTELEEILEFLDVRTCGEAEEVIASH